MNDSTASQPMSTSQNEEKQNESKEAINDVFSNEEEQKSLPLNNETNSKAVASKSANKKNKKRKCSANTNKSTTTTDASTRRISIRLKKNIEDQVLKHVEILSKDFVEIKTNSKATTQSNRVKSQRSSENKNKNAIIRNVFIKEIYCFKLVALAAIVIFF